MDKYIMITTTFDNKEEANKIIEILLEKRLVSCCQLSNITSSYHWKGKIEHTEELLLQMKSKKELTLPHASIIACCSGVISVCFITIFSITN